jgi:hypothetical protein
MRDEETGFLDLTQKSDTGVYLIDVYFINVPMRNLSKLVSLDRVRLGGYNDTDDI